MAQAAPPSATDPGSTLTGAWSGNGANCGDPLAIIVRGKSISEIMSGTTQKGSITAVSAAGTVTVAWPDETWTYKVAGDALTMAPQGGAPMTYQRCAG